MAAFLGLFLLTMESKRFDLRQVSFLGLLAAGLGSMHYRVSLITMVGAGTLLFVMQVTGRLRGMSWKIVAYKLAIIGGMALLFFIPWIWHVVTSRTNGYPLVHAPFDPSYFSLKRVGKFALDYQTNLLLLSAIGAAFGWGLLRKDWRMIWMVLWAGVCLVLSLPRFAGVFMDFVSVVISGYIPLSVGIGWLVAEIAKPHHLVKVGGKSILLLVLAGITLGSMPAFMRNIKSGTAFVKPDDLKAIEWVRGNTAASDYFMVNLYHFGFSPDLIIAPDAGYWLPLLGERRTVSLPMSYMSEKLRTPEGIAALKELDALKGHLCTPEAEALLSREGVTHVFVGSAGGPIVVEELLNCPDYSVVFQYQATHVFRFLPQSGKGPGQ